MDEATSLLGEHGDDAIAIAGGAAVTVLMKLGLIQPAHIVSLSRLEGLHGIRDESEGLWIGALTTHRQCETSPIVRAFNATLAETFAKVATIRIRNQGTLGGNIVHADPAQDPPPALIALDATAVIAGPGGVSRETPLDGLFTGFFSVAMEPGEVLTGVRIPRLAPTTRTTYHKFLPRTVDDYATVSVAAAARVDGDGRIADVRIVLGAVGATPIRAVGAEATLSGQRPSPQAIAEAAALVRDEIDPIGDTRGSREYKLEMASVWTARALTEVTA